MPIPLLLVGDGPGQHSGLGRIATDLMAQLWGHRERLGIAPAQFCLEPLPGTPLPWPTYLSTVAEEKEWGRALLERAWLAHAGERPGVILTVWDPARCAAFLPAIAALSRAQWWGYFAIDGWNPQEALGGPAAELLGHYSRVLGYGRWGAGVLERTLRRPVVSLPHGIQPQVFSPVGPVAEALADYALVIGCVAANQPRKDLGLLFDAVARTRDQIPGAHLWLHIDQLTGTAWSVAELTDRFSLEKSVTVTTELSDQDLAAHYRACAVTIAPGLGEGFGYPIVESLACGVPVAHGTYGGGTELVPHPAWRFPQRSARWEGVYVIERPVYDPQDVANAALRAIRWREAAPSTVQAYCTGAVSYLSWEAIWPRWEGWVAEGLDALGLRRAR